MSDDDQSAGQALSTSSKVKDLWSQDEAEMLEQFRARDKQLEKELDELTERRQGFEKLLVWIGSLSIGIMVGITMMLFMAGGATQ